MYKLVLFELEMLQERKSNHKFYFFYSYSKFPIRSSIKIGDYVTYYCTDWKDRDKAMWFFNLPESLNRNRWSD